MKKRPVACVPSSSLHIYMEVHLHVPTVNANCNVSAVRSQHSAVDPSGGQGWPSVVCLAAPA